MTKSEDEPADRSARTKKGDATEEDEADRCRVGTAHSGGQLANAIREDGASMQSGRRGRDAAELDPKRSDENDPGCGHGRVAQPGRMLCQRGRGGGERDTAGSEATNATRRAEEARTWAR